MLVLAGVGTVTCRRSTPNVCPDGMTVDSQKSKPGQFLWCRGPSKSARYTDFYPGGKEKRQVCEYRDGRPEGHFAAWLPGGKPWIAGQYVAGNPEGRWTQWDSAGNRAAEGEYRSGRFVAGAPVAGTAVCERLHP
jgi:antitoxin component YwqK of YwqJK toxin-antitoxin module